MQDDRGNVVTDSPVTISMALMGGTGGAALGGALTQTTSQGVAMFATLTVDSAGAGYALRATAGDLMSTTSGSFTISRLDAAAVYVHLESDAGDYIGAGQKYSYDPESAIISATATGNHLTLNITGAQSWIGEFQGPSSQTRLTPGQYTGLQRYPFNDPAQGGLSWYGEGRGCNTLVGSFVIDSVTYVVDSLTGIDLSFEQHCEGGTPALRGTIHWRAGVPFTPPGPVYPVPAGLWRPAASSTPASGNFVYLQSDTGDYIGGGGTHTYTPQNSTISVTAGADDVSIRVFGDQTWAGGLRTMVGVSPVQPGFYSDLGRVGFQNPVKGGFGWGGGSSGCNASIAWAAIDRIVYTNGTLSGLDMRFEYHCELAVPALRGVIHWSG
ncbi:MAG TPA: hypothetical protein VGV12_09840 [Gemmatimonadales bacterium]|nr:hypothetical protein [Gemmatimonadales bacterium]